MTQAHDQDSPSVKVAVVGASGYSGEELMRLLLAHPEAELTAVTSRQYAGKSVAQVYRRLAHLPRAGSLVFSEPSVAEIASRAQVAFLALPHGVAVQFAEPLLEAGCVVIDLSADFRVKSPETYKAFYGEDHPTPHLLGKSVYGLPELNRKAIQDARLIASPGCYPTSVLIPALPLLQESLVEPSEVIADSLSGVTGAGRKVDAQFLFGECNESLRPYGVPRHRHLSEMEQELSKATGQEVVLQFTPHLMPINRGILTTLYFRPVSSIGRDESSIERLRQRVAACFENAYGSEPFVRLLGEAELPDTKHVVGTNVLELGWRVDPRTGRLIVMSAEDNLMKGASGQAVQSFNIRCGFSETAGLL